MTEFQPTGKKPKTLWLSSGLFLIVLVGVIVLVVALGKVYRERIIRVADITSPPEYETIEKKKLKKITIKKRGETGCLEVTPDGVVRVYESCGGELESANRPVNPKNILKLFQLLAKEDFERVSPDEDMIVYELIIETDQGTEIVYLVGDSGSSAVEEIIDTIEDIEADLPDMTSTPFLATSSPQTTLPPGTIPPPSPSGIGFSSPDASPGSGSADTPFVCDFDPQNPHKPFNVSNIICTEQPH